MNPNCIFYTNTLVLLKDVLLRMQTSYPQAMCTVPPKSSIFLGEKRQMLAAFQVVPLQLINCVL